MTIYTKFLNTVCETLLKCLFFYSFVINFCKSQWRPRIMNLAVIFTRHLEQQCWTGQVAGLLLKGTSLPDHWRNGHGMLSSCPPWHHLTMRNNAKLVELSLRLDLAGSWQSYNIHFPTKPFCNENKTQQTNQH